MTQPATDLHPMEEHLEERFAFLDDRQRRILRQIIRAEHPTARAADFIELIRDLAWEIDAEAEWKRIEAMSPAEVEAELTKSGYDVEAGRASLRETLLQYGIDISPAARRARERQQEAWLEGKDVAP